MLFNGAPLNKRAKRQTGYVMQDDLLYEALTVFETLVGACWWWVLVCGGGWESLLVVAALLCGPSAVRGAHGVSAAGG